MLPSTLEILYDLVMSNMMKFRMFHAFGSLRRHYAVLLSENQNWFLPIPMTEEHKVAVAAAAAKVQAKKENDPNFVDTVTPYDLTVDIMKLSGTQIEAAVIETHENKLRGRFGVKQENEIGSCRGETFCTPQTLVGISVVLDLDVLVSEEDVPKVCIPVASIEDNEDRDKEHLVAGVVSILRVMENIAENKILSGGILDT